MPYLTKLFLPPTVLWERKILDDYSIHRFVYSLFPGRKEGARRFLYADKGPVKGGRLLLILSNEEPVYPEGVSSSSRILSEEFFRFSDYRFEVELNPVKKIRECGKRMAVLGQLDLLNWFVSHTEKWGFFADTRYLEVFPRPSVHFPKGEGEAVFNRVLFRGRLKVTDPALFQNSLYAGLGHGKAFGFGLLQLVPIDNNH